MNELRKLVFEKIKFDKLKMSKSDYAVLVEKGMEIGIEEAKVKKLVSSCLKRLKTFKGETLPMSILEERNVELEAEELCIPAETMQTWCAEVEERLKELETVLASNDPEMLQSFLAENPEMEAVSKVPLSKFVKTLHTDVVQCFNNGERMIINKQIDGHSIQIVKGSMTDPRDGKVYETVEIGSHIWLAENLNYETSDSLCYDNDDENAKKYGRLYKFSDAKNACPPGWHLPSSNEIESLVHAVGDMSIAGKSLKSVSGWQSKEGQSTKNLDSVGFSALPAGYYVNEGDPEENYFDGIGKESIIWFDSGSIYLYHDNCVDIDFDDNECDYYFCSVRCVKDETYYKIIRVVNGVVSVASSDGSFFNVPIEELDFEPKVGDVVQCFKKGKDFIVLKDVPRQSFSVHNESRLQTQKESQNFVPTKNVFGEEKKSNGFFFVSLIILGIVAIVVVGIYFYTKNNPTDLAREYCESVSCYVENHSSACRHEANYIRNMYIKMSSKDSEMFRRYIANHCDAGGNYEMLLKTGF